MKTKHYLYQKLSLGMIFLILSSFTILNAIHENFLYGTVYDEFEQPLSEVKITNLQNLEVTSSDKEGHFKIKGSLSDSIQLEHPSKISTTVKIDKLSDNKVYLLMPNPITSDKLNPLIKTETTSSLLTVSGIVSDNIGPLFGANVFCKKNKAATTTDSEGRYSIVVNKGDLLEFSFIGMENCKLIVRESIVNVKMKVLSSVTLDDVVVTSSYRESDSDDERTSYTPSKSYTAEKEVSSSLAAKVSGLAISSDPASDSKVLIRGARTISKETLTKTDKSTAPSITTEIKAGKLTAG